jgi:Tol biopolymer transport system component
MFGDLPYTDEASYSARIAVSLRRHTFAEVGGDFDPDLDASGERMVFSSTRHNVKPDLYLKSVTGLAVTQLTSDPSSEVQPAFSPDGTRVAFASDHGGDWDIWVVSVEGGPPVQITHDIADDVHPSWSPDGSKLVYCSLPSGGGQWELWVSDATTGASRTFIGYGLFPEWSPVGDTILFQRARERSDRWFSIWTLTLLAGEPRYPTELATSSTQAMILPCWSPDGRRVAFATSRSGVVGPASTPPTGAVDIWVMDVDGRRKTRLTDGYSANYGPAFAPDGRIYFTSDRSGAESVWSLLPPGAHPGGQVPDGQTTHTADGQDGEEAGVASAAPASDGL